MKETMQYTFEARENKKGKWQKEREWKVMRVKGYEAHIDCDGTLIIILQRGVTEIQRSFGPGNWHSLHGVPI
jgi:hypothetical protein